MGGRKQTIRWVALLVLSVPLAGILYRQGVPGSFLIGPMVVAIGFGAAGSGIRMPPISFAAAQAVIACLVAQTLNPSILISLARDWGPMSLAVVTTILSGAIAGWVLVRVAGLPGTTAAWGSTPGAATAMVAMAGDFGADIRLVAFMQYLRMVIVILSAALVSHVAFGVTSTSLPAAGAGGPVAGELVPLLETLAVAGISAWAGRRLRIPAGGLLLPMAVTALLHVTGLMAITLPSWLLAVTYLALGWYVGLGFTREVLTYALRAVPKLIVSILLLIGLCALSAWMLTGLLPIDGLTAYLATSPGGLDSIVIIAVGSHADAPFVIATQTFRLFAVMLTGPSIARFLSRTAPA